MAVLRRKGLLFPPPPPAGGILARTVETASVSLASGESTAILYSAVPADARDTATAAKNRTTEIQILSFGKGA